MRETFRIILFSAKPLVKRRSWCLSGRLSREGLMIALSRLEHVLCGPFSFKLYGTVVVLNIAVIWYNPNFGRRLGSATQ